MKSLFRTLTLASLMLAVPAVYAADEAPAAHKEKKPETEITKQMDKMNGAFRKLRRQAGDATKNADSLDQVAIIRESSAASAKLTPVKAAEIPEADRAKWVADYQAKMKDFAGLLDKLEAAFKAGQNEEAVKIVEAMGKARQEGHKEYKAKDL